MLRVHAFCCPGCALVMIAMAVFAQMPRPAPRIQDISPARAAVGNRITLTGTGFGDYVVNQSSVQVGRCPSYPGAPGAGLIAIPAKDIVSWTDAQIVFVLPARTIGLVSVMRADGQMSEPREFEVIAACPAAAPALTRLDPQSVTAGSGDTVVTVVGADFAPDATGKADGAPVPTTYLTSNSLRIVLPAALLRERKIMQITVSTSAGTSPSLPFAVTAGRPAIAAVVNAASLRDGPVAPGEIITLFGSDLGPSAPAMLNLDPGGRVSTLLAETRVWFDEIPAPLIYSSERQLNAVVPFGVQGKSAANLIVEYFGMRSEAVLLAVAPSAPGVFTVDGSGRGRGAVLNQDGTVNCLSTPAVPGSVVVLYATGAGAFNPRLQDGTVVADASIRGMHPISVQIGGIPADVLYFGAAPGFVAGLYQINVRVPEGVAGGGPAALLISIGGAASQPGVIVEVSPR